MTTSLCWTPKPQAQALLQEAPQAPQQQHSQARQQQQQQAEAAGPAAGVPQLAAAAEMITTAMRICRMLIRALLLAAAVGGASGGCGVHASWQGGGCQGCCEGRAPDAAAALLACVCTQLLLHG